MTSATENKSEKYRSFKKLPQWPQRADFQTSNLRRQLIKEKIYK